MTDPDRIELQAPLPGNALDAVVAPKAEAMHERDRARAAGHAERRDAARTERAAVAAGIRPTCPHCDVPRTYEGRRNVVSLPAPEESHRTEDPGRARPETRAYEEYVCPRCGSVELVRAGTLDHPLA